MSVSSTNNADITVRHDKLTTMYKDLVTMAKRLRSGVLEEQAKSKELASELTATKASVHKLTSENTALQVRNNHLAETCAQLQKELDLALAKKKKDKHYKDDLVTDGLNRKIAVLEENLVKCTQERDNLEARVKDLEGLLDEQSRFVGARDDPNSAVPENRPLINTDDANLSLDDGGLEIEGVMPFQIRAAFPDMALYQLGQVITRHIASVLELLAQRSVLHPFDYTLEQIPDTIRQFERVLLNASVMIDECLASFEEEYDKGLITLAFIHIQGVFHQMGIEKINESLRFMLENENNKSWCNWQKENEEWFTALCSFLQIIANSDIGMLFSGSGIHQFESACKRVYQAFQVKRDTERTFTTKRLHCVNDSLCTSFVRLHKYATILRDHYKNNFPIQSSSSPANTIEEVLVVKTKDAEVQTSEVLIELQEQIKVLQESVVALQEEKKSHLAELALLRFQIKNSVGRSPDAAQGPELTNAFVRAKMRGLETALQSAREDSNYYMREVENLNDRYDALKYDNCALNARLEAELEAKLELKQTMEDMQKSYSKKVTQLTLMVAGLEERLAKKNIPTKGRGFGFLNNT